MLSSCYPFLFITFNFLLVFFPLQVYSAPEKLLSNHHDTVNAIQSDPLYKSRSVSNLSDAKNLPTPLSVYGPVSQNEALWDIANKVRLEPGITTAQMTVALFRNNSDSFLDKNLNRLKLGVMLKIPGKKYIIKVSKKEAETILQQHWKIWQNNNGKKTANKITSLPENDIQTEQLKKQSTPGTLQSYAQSDRGSTVQKVTFDTKKEVIAKTVHESNTHYEQNLPQLASPEKSNNSTISLLDSFSMVKIETFLNDVYHDLQQRVISFNQDPLLKIEKIFKLPSKSPSLALFIIIIFILFILLVYFLRKNESKFLAEIELPIPNRVDPLLPEIKVSEQEIIEQKTPIIRGRVSLLEQAIEKEQQTDSCDLMNSVQENALYSEENHLISEERTEPVFCCEITESNVVDIKQFLKPAEERNEVPGILGPAYEKNDFSYPTQEDLTGEDGREFSLADDSLDSNLQLKYIQNQIQDTKSIAFLNATESKNMHDSTFENDFFQLKDNDKIDVFIEEFEQLLATLSKQASEIEKNSDELESLIQFKLSIHFFKVLSEIMQAKQLYQFSQTVIDFLEDIIDKKVTMTVDISNRLSIAAGYYVEYINCVKLLQSPCHRAQYKVCEPSCDT